jgi:formate/nitrite transporter FocA (FNT family)
LNKIQVNNNLIANDTDTIRMQEAIPGLEKMAYAFMFSWSLVMILFMNAELGTSNIAVPNAKNKQANIERTA